MPSASTLGAEQCFTCSKLLFIAVPQKASDTEAFIAFKDCWSEATFAYSLWSHVATVGQQMRCHPSFATR